MAETTLLLLQGGLGNQLLQLVLTRTLAAHSCREVQISPVLLESKARKWRGVTQRQPSPLIDGNLLSPVPWHRYLSQRLTTRLPLDLPWLLNDRRLLEYVHGADLLDEAQSIELVKTYATHPLLFESQFDQEWSRLTIDSSAGHTDSEIAVHLRRGDYLQPRFGFFPLPLAYYRTALHHVFNAFPGLERRVRVFSDDLPWCQQHLTDRSWKVVGKVASPEADLAAMASARVLIISNSSLSAVAAHLGQLSGANELVIAPDRWLLPSSRRKLGDLGKPSWVLLPHDP